MKKSILVLVVLASLVMLVGCAKEPDSFVVSESVYFVTDANKGNKAWPKDSKGNEVYYFYTLSDAKGSYKKYKGDYIGYKNGYNGGWGAMFITQCLSRVEEMISEGNFSEFKDGDYNCIVLNSYPSTYKDSDATIEIGDYYDTIKIEANYPWINGEQDFSVLSKYQAVPDFSAAFVSGFPVVGNKVKLTWHAKSDVDISKLYCRLVDGSYDADWWTELNKAKQNLTDNDPFSKDSTFIMKENIKAGEVFDVDFTLPVEEKPSAQVSLCIWYNPSDATGPATITSVK